MSALSGHVDDYLRLRRALGFKLERAGWLLPQLVAYVHAADAPSLTSELAIAWARLPAGAHPNHWAQRLAVARGFARYLQTIDPVTEVPPPGVFPTRRHRPAPYLWSPGDILGLLDGARGLPSPLRAATHEALFGLLAASGMRVGEAIALQVEDVDLGEGVVTIREAKLHRSRLGAAAPDHHRGAAPLREPTRPAVSTAARNSVLPIQHRHPARPQRREQDAAADHDRHGCAHRHSASTGT